MRMLDSDDVVDIEVLKEDQDRINAFSRLVAVVEDAEERIKALEEHIEQEEEVETEVELMDDDELVMYRLDTVLMHIPASEAAVRIGETLEKIRAEKDAEVVRMKAAVDEMGELKKALYAKFGDNINLERSN